MPPPPDFAPVKPSHQRVWERLTIEAREVRVRDALTRKAAVDAMEARRPGESERDALDRLAKGVDRGSYRRWRKMLAADGLEGLVDWRIAPKPEVMPAVVRDAICTLRRSDPDIDVEAIVAHLAKHHDFTTSATTVKRVLSRAGLARRRGPPAGRTSGESRLELGGMKLVEAACQETGYLSALATAVVGYVEAAGVLAPQRPADVTDRDEFGRFEPEYNERFRKEPGDVVGPGFESVEEKRKEVDPGRLHIAGATQALVERKLQALLVSPLIGSGRWDGMRVPRGELLGELCGFPYMPSTLDLFTRELKQLGVSSTLWEVHARLMLEATEGWGTKRMQSVLFIDGTAKPIWTDLFSHATKVSQVGRVMPGLEVVSFHLGYGVPLWMSTHSGRAPLVKHVPMMLDELEARLGGAEVGRIVVIDAEGNSVAFLHGLECGQRSRAWITRLKPSFIESHPVFGHTNWRDYRDGDRVRMGRSSFKLPGPEGEEFRMRVVEIQRRTKGTTTYLGASTLLNDLEWKPQDIGDLYFERWPQQEANFRAVNQAVGFKKVHGYGKQLVENVAVVTELDRLDKKISELQARWQEREEDFDTRAGKLETERKALEAIERRREDLTRQIARQLSRGAQVTSTTQKLSLEAASYIEKSKQQSKKIAGSERQADKAAKTLEHSIASLDKAIADRQAIESRRTIFRHDVELDSLFALLKVGLVFLVTYVLKEFLGGAKIEPVTFLERLATLPARRRVTPGVEIVTFEYNRRDPEMMGLLSSKCDEINARGLKLRNGRKLRILVDDAPPTRLPPPKRKLVRSLDRNSPQ